MKVQWEDDLDLEVERKGKTYTVTEPGHARALTIQAIIAGHVQEAEGIEAWRPMLGDALDEMLADECPDRFITMVGLASLAFFIHGDAARAEQIIREGVSPEALAASAANQQSPTTSSSTRSTSTAAAAKTRSRASGSGTRTSRRTSSAKTRKPSQS